MNDYPKLPVNFSYLFYNISILLCTENKINEEILRKNFLIPELTGSRCIPSNVTLFNHSECLEHGTFKINYVVTCKVFQVSVDNLFKI